MRDKTQVQLRKVGVVPVEQRLYPVPAILEMWSLAVALLYRLPVLLSPILVGYFHVLYRHSSAVDGDGEPLQTLRCLYDVSVSPISPRVLAVIVENELVRLGYQPEIPSPRDVVALDD